MQSKVEIANAEVRPDTRRAEWVEPVIEVIEAADAESGMRGGGGESGRYS